MHARRYQKNIRKKGRGARCAQPFAFFLSGGTESTDPSYKHPTRGERTKSAFLNLVPKINPRGCCKRRCLAVSGGQVSNETPHTPDSNLHTEIPLHPMAHAAANSSGPANTTNGPLLATGDWTKNLVHLAKTAELK